MRFEEVVVAMFVKKPYCALLDAGLAPFLRPNSLPLSGFDVKGTSKSNQRSKIHMDSPISTNATG